MGFDLGFSLLATPFLFFFFPPPIISVLSEWSSAELMLGERPIPTPEWTLADRRAGGVAAAAAAALLPPSLCLLTAAAAAAMSVKLSASDLVEIMFR